MSLKGRVYCENINEIGGFDEAVLKIKEAIGKLTGTSIGVDGQNPLPNIYLEGIVQGDIKLQASNDWKTTTFYGLADSLKGVSAGGGVVPAQAKVGSIIKLANTIANVSGYTLSGTGPSSRKMYNGSNLTGFNIQFKWYTPYMKGWYEAIQSLCLLAWPSSIFNSKRNPEIQTKELEESLAAKERIESDYKEIIRILTERGKRISFIQGAVSLISNDFSNRLSYYNRFGLDQYQGYEDLEEIKSLISQSVYTNSPGLLSAASLRLEGSERNDNLVLTSARNRSPLKVTPPEIGKTKDTTQWYYLSESDLIGEDGAQLDGGGTPPTPIKNEVDVDVIGGIKDLISSTGPIFQGLLDSMSKNPPRVCLEILDSTGEIKYRFSPLVITSFAITSSRETVNNEPVIVTIDVGFDYYMINATDAFKAPKQSFAGAPIFKTEVEE